jgi:hypothetical protein
MKNQDFAVVLVVVLLAASAAGGMLFYFKNNNVTGIESPPNNGIQTTPVHATTSGTPTYSTEGFQDTGSVLSVDSSGGHYAIANVAIGNPLWVTLSSSQLPQVHFGEDFEVKMTYSPRGQTMLDTYGKVISVSSNGNCQPIVVGIYSQQPCAIIALLDSSAMSTVPSAWNPQVGGQIILSFSPETSTPLVVITGLQLSAATCNEYIQNPLRCLNSTSTSQFAAFVSTPTCLQSSLFSAGPPCVFAASGSSLSISFAFSNYPFCLGCTYNLTVTTSDPGFSVTGVQPSGIGYKSGAVVTLSIPTTDFVGTLHLAFIYIPQ